MTLQMAQKELSDPHNSNFGALCDEMRASYLGCFFYNLVTFCLPERNRYMSTDDKSRIRDSRGCDWLRMSSRECVRSLE